MSFSKEADMSRCLGWMVFTFAAAALVISAPNVVSGQDAHKVLAPNDLKWGPGPAAMPKGQTAALLAGDPAKSGLFILRAKIPDGYAVAPHWHSQSEHLTVLSGRLHVGMGDKFDRSKGDAIGPGGFIIMPANMHHYVWASGETVLQVTAMGPFDITYIDPKDDPRKATADAR
jgi:mannose-6-phosphate isomerase-like protein (cupin superfamily)